MSRSGAVTFKGAPLTLAGNEVKVGQPAPDFKLHYFEGGLKEVKLADLKGKPTILSVVPSLDTPVCSAQTVRFAKDLEAMGDKIGAYTVSLDLPFAMKRFCTEHDVKRPTSLSDVVDHSVGEGFGVLIDGLPIPLLARAIFVVDSENTIQYVQIVPEIAEEPDYSAAMAALTSLTES